MRPSTRLLALVCALVMLAIPAAVATPALAAGNKIINDCQSNGQLTHPYTVKQLRHALAVMPATVKQYTSCFDVVQGALVSARKHGGIAPAGSGNGGGSSFLPTWLIIVIVVVLLAAVTFGALAIRRRRTGGDGFDDDGTGGSGPGGPGDGPGAPSGGPGEAASDEAAHREAAAGEPAAGEPVAGETAAGEARTRVMPSVPPGSRPDDTAETRAMPSVPSAEDPDEAPTRLDEPGEGERP